MRKLLKYAWLLGLFSLTGPVAAATRVYFDKDEYIVSSVDETFDVQILIDGDDRTTEIEPVRGGLFSFGTEVTFDAAKAQLSGPSAVKPVSELDYSGFFAGALTEVGAGRAAGKGNIDQVANPLLPYDGDVLMTLTVTNKAAAVDQYPLALSFFRTLGDNEDLFVSGSGAVMDDGIVFGEALVRVVPEPSAAVSCLAGIGLTLLSLSRRWRRACNARP